MALIEVNGHGVITGRIVMPRSGAWYADLAVDSTDAITGAVTISIADGRLVLKGTINRGAEYVETAIMRVVAGAGGLSTKARARSYNQSSLSIVLRDLLATAGEAMSSTADATTLGRKLAAWTTAALPVGVLFARALSSAAPTASWRALPDGTIWVGPETWPDSGLTTDDYQIINEDPRQQLAELGVETPLLLPGTTLAGRRVSRVEHTIGPEGVRSWAWFEDVATGLAPVDDRLKAALGAVVRGSLGSLVYNAQHFARVIAQSGDTIDVEIENPTIAKLLPSMQKVPLMKPTPGATLQMKAAGRVLVGWSGGDPARPYALAYDAGTSVSKLVLNADQIILGGEIGAEFGVKGQTLQTYLNALALALVAHAHAGVTTGGGLSGPSPAFATLSPPPTITTTKTKVS